MSQQFFSFFCPWWPWPFTSTFQDGQDFCTMYLTAKFDCPTFSRSEVIVRTNKHADKQTNRRRWKHPSRFATLRRWIKMKNSPTQSMSCLPEAVRMVFYAMVDAYKNCAVINYSARNCSITLLYFFSEHIRKIHSKTRMWANAQPDGRPAEHRWRPLFNAPKFGWRPLLDAVQ